MAAPTTTRDLVSFQPEPPRGKKCKECKKRPAGERDQDSPYCGKCDPDGVRRFYDILASV